MKNEYFQTMQCMFSYESSVKRLSSQFVYLLQCLFLNIQWEINAHMYLYKEKYDPVIYSMRNKNRKKKKELLSFHHCWVGRKGRIDMVRYVVKCYRHSDFNEKISLYFSQLTKSRILF